MPIKKNVATGKNSNLSPRVARKQIKSGISQLQQIAIIGSTGSIGRQTLEVIENQPNDYSVFGLACHENIELLFEQIQKFRPKIVAVYKKSAAKKLAKLLIATGASQNLKWLQEGKNSAKKCARAHFYKSKNISCHALVKNKMADHSLPQSQMPNVAQWSAPSLPQILSGKAGWEKLATHPGAQKIIFASNGLTALPALIKTIKAHKKIALANKEMLVAAGRQIMKTARQNNVTIVPIDSEHSAIFQCLQGENPDSIEKIILTCSGGPFYGKKKSDLQQVTPAQALKHPTWKMGQKISVDCATLMNKGFELIEAMHLFGLREDQIEILIHPESIIHSMVQFKDGSVKAQMGTPDMRLPISYALAWPNRPITNWPRIDFCKLQKLTFLKPDFTTFEGPLIAREIAHQTTQKSLKKNHNPQKNLIKNNNEAVEKFLAGKISFNQIYDHLKNQLFLNDRI